MAEGQGFTTFPSMVSNALQRGSHHPRFVPSKSCILPLGQTRTCFSEGVWDTLGLWENLDPACDRFQGAPN